MEKLNMQTTNIVDENIKRIGELFPNCLTERLNEEGKPEMAIDFDQLRQELSKDIVEGPEERYQFTWPDKRNAIRLANAPTTDTLRPCCEESVDFDNTQNLYIEGDNLQVLKLLRENYLGKVKMIYIDPPYNTGNDFVYNDDFSQTTGEYMHNSGQEDEEGNRLVANTESNGRFHTDWLNMIYPRLKIAKDLLSEDGVIFISIDDNEVKNLRRLCDEIFGESNFVTQFIWHNNKKGRQMDKYIKTSNEFVLMYSKNILCLELLDKKIDVNVSEYPYKDNISAYKKGYPLHNGTAAFHIDNRPNLCYTIYYNPNNDDIVTIDEKTGSIGNWALPISDKGRKLMDLGYVRILPKRNSKYNTQRVWRWGQEKTNREKNDLFFIEEVDGFYPYQKERVEDGGTKSVKYTNYIDIDTSHGRISMNDLFDYLIVFDFPKPVLLLCHLLGIIPNDDSAILDFFSGSATTAHAVMQLNAEDGGKRKFIMVQLPEATDEKSEAYKAGYKNICEIGKERIRRAGKKIKEESPLTTQGLDTGFRVLKLDSSNMEDVYYTPAEFNEQKLFDDNIKPDRTEEDLLFQTMIELGIELSAKIEKRSIAGKTVWSVSDGYLMACFDEDVNETTITEIARQQPYYFVMRDSSLANDQVADNFEQIWEEYSKDTVRRIL